MDKETKTTIWAILSGLYTAAYMDGKSEEKVKTDVIKNAQKELIDIIKENE